MTEISLIFKSLSNMNTYSGGGGGGGVLFQNLFVPLLERSLPWNERLVHVGANSYLL